MGDGQHAWAAAEWLLMMRNCFVREEGQALILVSGVAKAWWQTGEAISFSNAPTQFGKITIRLQYSQDAETKRPQIWVEWQGQWHGQAPNILVQLPGFEQIIATAGQTQMLFWPELGP
jgi:hypothetical protein